MKKIISLFILLASAFTANAIQAQPCSLATQPCYYDSCPSSCEEECGVYVSAFGGANWLSQHSKKHHVKSTYDTGYSVGGAVGYRFNPNFRVEGEVAYRYNHLDSLRGCYGDKIHPKGHTSLTTLMVNAYYDFAIDACFTPYIGVGAGYAHTKAHFSHEGFWAKGTDNGFAGQAIVGVSKRVYANTDLGLEYRYVAAYKYFHEQGVNVALRYAF